MKSAGRLIFIVPPSRWTDPRYSLGIMYVSGFLKEHGFDNIIIDDGIMRGPSYSHADAVRSIIRRIEDERPEIVGMTCLVNEIKEIIDLNNKIKEVSSKTKTLVGGTQAFDTPEIFLRNGIDYVVRGEGEITTLELVECLSRGKEVDKVKGVVWTQGDTIIHNAARTLIENLDSIPYPSYDLINMKRHMVVHNWVIRGLPLKTAMVMTSRGCPYSCSFCECNAIFGRKVRYRSAENIYGEIRLLRDKYGAEAIWFVDDTLLTRKEHVLDICRIMKSLKMWWGCQGRVNTIDDVLMRRLKENGCIQIDFGVESGSNRILHEIIDKHITTDQTRKAFEICHKYQMRTLANLMIGLPTESRDEMSSTLLLGKEIDASSYVLSIATPLPNTRLWQMIKPDISDDELYKMNFFNSSLMDKFNRSEVGDLVTLRNEFLQELNNHHGIRKRLSVIRWFIRILLKTKYKKEYFSFLLVSCRDLAAAIIMLLDKRFGTHLYRKAVGLDEALVNSTILNAVRRIAGPAAIRWKHRLRVKVGNSSKLHLGCGNQRFNGYTNIDWRKTRATDFVCDITKLPYSDNSVELIESYHAIEHLPRHQLREALIEWHRVLFFGGKLIIECPDFDVIVKKYLEGDEKQLDGIFALQRFEGDYHYFGYNFRRLRRLLEECGFSGVEEKAAQDYHIEEWPCIRVECVKEENGVLQSFHADEK